MQIINLHENNRKQTENNPPILQNTLKTNLKQNPNKSAIPTTLHEEIINPIRHINQFLPKPMVANLPKLHLPQTIINLQKIMS